MYIVVNNYGGAPMTYSPNPTLSLYPQDARFPVLPLEFLAAEKEIPANMQDVLLFDVPATLFTHSIEFQNDNNVLPGQPYLYFSMPLPRPLTAADCPNTGVNAETNECVPLEDFCMGMEPEQMINAEGDGCDDIPSDTGMTATVTPPENGGGVSVVVSKDERDFPVVGAIIMGLLIFGLSNGGEEGEFSYSPSFGYSVNESGYSANVGGRMNFRKGDWRLYWTAGQTNANGKFGEFRYSSGGEYKTDFWQASFSESVSGETTDYDLSLSADLSGGIWQFSPVYRIHSRLEEGKTATKNTLNLEGALSYNRWTIRQSAGFGWRRTDEFGDSAKFRVEAVREF